ncbi:MAG: FAD binding domain-containing protein, partial [Acidimicrobiia bacterium]|nr:FAD binding domain-containing protein [Acidimicrobiia bacterium]
DGEVEVSSQRGPRRIAASELYGGFLTTSVEPDELLTAVHLPAWPSGAGWSFLEFSRRSGDFALAGVAAMLRLDLSGTIAEARLALSGMDQTPVRASDAEATLVGQRPSDDLWAAASTDAVVGLEPPSDLHGGSAYRRHLASVLVRRALHEAHQRAEGSA